MDGPQRRRPTEPDGAVELLAFATRCYDTERFALSVRFYESTFQGQPKIVDDRNAQHRYNAACCASLAIANPLSSDPPLNDSDTTRLREQARLWLQAELDAWKVLMDAATQQERAKIASTLAHWQQDSDLVAIRDSQSLDKLTEPERQAWQTFWKQVADAHQRASE